MKKWVTLGAISMVILCLANALYFLRWVNWRVVVVLNLGLGVLFLAAVSILFFNAASTFTLQHCWSRSAILSLSGSLLLSNVLLLLLFNPSSDWELYAVLNVAVVVGWKVARDHLLRRAALR